MALYTVAPFILALFVAFASYLGTARVSGLVAIETLSLIFAIVRLTVRRLERDAPLNSQTLNNIPPTIPPPTKMSITLRTLHVLATGLMIPFVEPLNVVGIVAAAVWSIGVVFVFGCVLCGLVELVRWKRVGGEVVQEEGIRGKEAGGKMGVEEAGQGEEYGDLVPALSRPQAQNMRTDSTRTAYYDTHTGTTPAQPQPLSPVGQNADYFQAR